MLGYLAWKKLRLAEETLNRPRQYSDAIEHHRLKDTFYWKEIRYMDGHKYDCNISDKYHHFYLYNNFNNPSLSYTETERNLSTGLEETVTYQIVSEDDNFEKTLIEIAERASGTGLSGSSSFEELEDKRPVPLPFRTWEVQYSNPPYPSYTQNIVGRLKNSSGGNISLEVLSCRESGVFAYTTRSYDRLRLGPSDIPYIRANEDTLTYNQKQSHIIIPELYIADTYNKEKKDNKSSIIRVYRYDYNSLSHSFRLKSASEKKDLSWRNKDLKVATVNKIDGERKEVKAKVKRISEDGCYAIIQMNIGYSITYQYDAAYYVILPDSKEWLPKAESFSQNKSLCFKTDFFSSIPNNLDPYSNAFRGYLDSIIPIQVFDKNGAPRKIVIFGVQNATNNETPDSNNLELFQNKKEIDIPLVQPIPPEDFSDFGFGITNGLNILNDGWITENY
jgi:hypothetical protein